MMLKNASDGWMADPEKLANLAVGQVPDLARHPTDLVAGLPVSLCRCLEVPAKLPPQLVYDVCLSDNRRPHCGSYQPSDI
jgi:hypothetical protein